MFLRRVSFVLLEKNRNGINEQISNKMFASDLFLEYGLRIKIDNFFFLIRNISPKRNERFNWGTNETTKYRLEQ